MIAHRSASLAIWSHPVRLVCGLLLPSCFATPVVRAQDNGAHIPVRVVATLPTYADLTRQIGGNQVLVTSIAHPLEDAHFVRPKPSFALELKRADLFITTGLDLELWVPPLLDRAGNSAVMMILTGTYQ